MHQTYTYTITTLLAQIGTLENAFRIDIDIVGVVPVAYMPNADQKEFMAGLAREYPAVFDTGPAPTRNRH